MVILHWIHYLHFESLHSLHLENSLPPKEEYGIVQNQPFASDERANGLKLESQPLLLCKRNTVRIWNQLSWGSEQDCISYSLEVDFLKERDQLTWIVFLYTWKWRYVERLEYQSVNMTFLFVVIFIEGGTAFVEEITMTEALSSYSSFGEKCN